MKNNILSKLLKLFLSGLIIFSIVFTVLTTTIIKISYGAIFTKYTANEHSSNLSYNDVKNQYERTIIHFNSGKNRLKGYLYGADNNKGLIVMAHGLGGGAESFLALIIYFVDHDWRVFAYDCTGSYESEGMCTKGLPQSVSDLKAALTYVESDESLRDLPLMLFGHSWGGYAVAAILNYKYDINAVVSVSGFNSPMEILMEKAKLYMGPLANLEYPFLQAQETLLFGKGHNLAAVSGINDTDACVMILHGNKDKTVSYDGSGIIAHRKEITNPNVIYLTINTKNRNGHRHLFLSNAAYQYKKEVTKLYQKRPSSSTDTLFSSNSKEDNAEHIDIKKANELETGFMNKINLFYESALTNRLAKQPHRLF